MNIEERQVLEFHKTFDLIVSHKPLIPDPATQTLRVALIQEELNELSEAFAENDVTAVADALADLLYVTYGAAIACGIDIDPVFQEVHRSNMTKVGGHKRADGKWVKPPTYSPANIPPILESQSPDVMR
jgi:predicted HAD superfamily Cof-like phosphohydrolase